MFKKYQKEEGYSLFEITVAMVIAGLMVAIGIPLVYNNTLVTSFKTGLKSDVTSVATQLAYIYDSSEPTSSQFTDLKRSVLADYLSTPEREEEKMSYVNAISYSRDENFNYCVEASDTYGGTEYTISYYTATGSIYESDCLDVLNGTAE